MLEKFVYGWKGYLWDWRIDNGCLWVVEIVGVKSEDGRCVLYGGLNVR